MKMGQNSFTNGCIMNVPKILFREFTRCKDGVRVLILHSDTSILQREIPGDQSHDSLPSGPPLVCMFNNQGATKWPVFWYTFCCIGGFGWILGVDFFWGILRIHDRRFSRFSTPEMSPFPQNQEIKEAFDLFDTDGSGRKQFGKAVRHLGRQGQCGISM